MSEVGVSRTLSRRLAAQAYVSLQPLLDRQLSPLGLAAIEALHPQPGQVILDVGCGTGQTTVQLADRVGPTGRVIGVDNAPEVLAAARDRAATIDTVSFVEADAATLGLPGQSLDAVYSRFGVMAFDRPADAFANLRRMLWRGGNLSFVCWQPLVRNELDRLPLEASGLVDRVDVTPFSLEDPHRVRTILAQAGFSRIAIEAHEQPVSCGDLDATLATVLAVGPLGRILRESPGLRAAAEARVGAALAGRGNDGVVELRAATWVVSARV